MRGSRKFIVCMLLLALLSVLMGATPGRGYSATKYALELDGVVVGWVTAVEGGGAAGEVVTEKMGPDYLAKKHIGAVKYEEISFKAGAGMSKAFYQWMQSTVNGRYTRKSGAIIAADYNNRELQRLTFVNAIITEIGMPALDAASKDAASFTIKIAPEMTRRTVSAGTSIRFPIDASKQKKWLPANFRLRIDGLEAASSRVNKIEALTIKQKVTEHAVGDGRDYEQEPTSLEIPNLVITFPESHADEVYKWHEAFVIRGESGQDKEKGGTLEFLSQDLKEVLFTLEFRQLGIFKLTPDKVEAGGEQIRRVKAEMYCEEMVFSAR
ncbi:MAG TPA: phage tail protein [Symbiobacteriaceae bacterium]|nr:phage tail protein [Symbiobacteriaceae bacterium]